MPRKLRMYLPGVPAHVVQRGNNREACFISNKWRHDYKARIVPTILLHLLRPWRSDVGGTRPGMVEGRTMQEQLSRITSGTVIESTVFSNILGQHIVFRLSND